MTQATTERTAKVTFDLPEGLLAALRSKASEEERTIAAELRLLVRRHVQQDRGARLRPV